MAVKYEFTDEFVEYEFNKLFRIKAVRDFGDVKAGDLGGFICKDTDIDEEGNAWVYDDARVLSSDILHDASVKGNALISHSCIIDNAYVGDNARVLKSTVMHNAIVKGNAFITYHITRNNRVFPKPTLESLISGRAVVYGNAKVNGAALIGAPTVGDGAEIVASVLCSNGHYDGSKYYVCEYLKLNGEICPVSSLIINYARKAQIGRLMEILRATENSVFYTEDIKQKAQGYLDQLTKNHFIAYGNSDEIMKFCDLLLVDREALAGKKVKEG